MKKLFRGLGSLILLFVAVAVIAVLNLLIHEFGHCITVDHVGGKCEGVYVPPGMKVWPPSGVGDPYPYPDKWNNAMGMALYDESAPTAETRGFVSFMGSGSTAILSLIALLALWILEPRGWGRNLLMIQSLFFGDLLFYTILPEWFGLRHFFLVGGDYPEPLEGAVRMGFERGHVIIGVLIFSGVMFTGWLAYVWKIWIASRK